MGRWDTAHMSLDERFDFYTRPAGECRVWVGARNAGGYGVFRVDGEQVLAHRFAAQRAGMQIEGLHVLHTCDTPECVEAGHLRPGTDADNQDDKARKLRNGRKLASAQVREIKALLQTDHLPLHEIAAAYGVGRKTIQRIKHEQIWKYA